MRPIKQQAGGALLTALFIMTLVAIVATAMSSRLQLDIYRTQLVVSHDRLYLASQVVSFWAMDELNKNKIYKKKNEQGLIVVFPKKLGSISKQVSLAGGIYDLQARFNLNNLADKSYINMFVNLLGSSYPALHGAERNDLAMAVNNWVTSYDLAQGKDSYTSYYLGQKPPYYPAHQLLSSASEFRLIKGVTGPMYLALEPIITALPETTPININTAPRRLLKALGNGLSKEQVNELLEAREEHAIKDMKDISELIKKIDLPTAKITIESNYFLSVANVKSGEFSLTVYTLLKRSKDKNKKTGVSIIRESIG